MTPLDALNDAITATRLRFSGGDDIEARYPRAQLEGFTLADAVALEAVVDRQQEALKRAIEVIEWCGENDKTPPYTYDPALKSTQRRDGSLPGMGKAFNTPAEFARYWPDVLREALGETR